MTCSEVSQFSDRATGRREPCLARSKASDIGKTSLLAVSDDVVALSTSFQHSIPSFEGCLTAWDDATPTPATAADTFMHKPRCVPVPVPVACPQRPRVPLQTYDVSSAPNAWEDASAGAGGPPKSVLTKRSLNKTNDQDESARKRAKLQEMIGAAGQSCHQCKSRRHVEKLVFCRNNFDTVRPSCRKKYCGPCLSKFYDTEASPSDTEFLCPSCEDRCTCASCRRRVAKKAAHAASAAVAAIQRSSNSSYSSVADHDSESDLPEPMVTERKESASPSRPRRKAAAPLLFPSMGLDFDEAVKRSEEAGVSAFMDLSDDEHVSLSLTDPILGSTDLFLDDALDLSSVGQQPEDVGEAAGVLFAVSQMPGMKERVQGLLDDASVPDADKVKRIASLLKGAVDVVPC